MAFCNSCGAAITQGTRFCSKCGAAITASTPVGAAPMAPVPGVPVPPVPPSTGGSSALKIILIVVGVIVCIGILALSAVLFVGFRIAKSAHVTQNGDHVTVDTPFGHVETSKDPEQAAKDLGVDIYPGAEIQKNGSSSATFGAIRTVTANFTSSDSTDKVCNFYRSKFPNANVSTSDQNRCTIVSNDPKNMVTINIEGGGDTTKLQITTVNKKATTSN